MFRLTLDPGATVTYVAELKTPKLPQLYLWEPEAYKDKATSLTLYKGIVIGIAGLLALFLTIVFVVKGAVIFPAAAALAWAVLAYVCIDFGFWSKVFGTEANADRIWRAGAETVLAATLRGLPLRLSQPQPMARPRLACRGGVARCSCVALVGLAVYDAPVAAGVARISLATIAAVGLHPGALSRHAWLRTRGDADPDLAPADGLGGGGGLHRHRLAHQRPRRRPRCSAAWCCWSC